MMMMMMEEEGFPPDLYGIEDDFEAQFADELEVLAELEAEASQPSSHKVSKFRQKKRTFEEDLSAADLVKDPADIGCRPHLKKPSQSQLPAEQGGDIISVTQEELKCPTKGAGSPPNRLSEDDPAAHTPKPKRRRLDAMKKLDFGKLDGTVLQPQEAPSFSLETRSEPQDQRIPKFPENMEESGLFPLHATLPEESCSRKVLKRPPILEDYISVTSSSGNRVFMVVEDDQVETKLCSSTGQNKFRPLHLLGVPFSYLKEQVAEERHKQMRESLRDIKDILSRCLDETDAPTGVPRAPESGEGGTQGRSGETAPNSLWVDFFAPRHYVELLSDDYTNRCLLKWLKLWDTVVFGKEKPSKRARLKAENKPAFKHLKDQQNKWKTKAQLTEDALEAELDPQNRPKYKVALLCGPPGLGKTTLAHVIAKHAGYNVVEMNASDDRSPEVFKTKIEAATQMKSVLGADEKPNCLIIDEIDGAPMASVNVLLSIANWKAVEADPERSAGGAGGKRRRQEGGLLLRPIICICNDQYVPSLRMLRQQAFLLNFPSTSPSRLVQRLHEIAVRQGMKADTGALMALCEKAENDIRSCINTLQFLHSRGKKELSIRMVQATKVGLKDQNKGLFSIWQEIFQLPKVQRQRIGFDPLAPVHTFTSVGDDPLGLATSKTSLNPMAQRFHRVLHLSSSSGEHEKLAQGLYDNFLNTKVKDSNFGSVCLALEWLGFSDLVNSLILHGQNFQLMRYLPFLPVAFHLLFAASTVPRLSYPHSHQEALAKLTQMQNLVASLISGIAPNSRGRTTPQSLVLEALCLLLEIISPKLRPVNTQLYSQREKQLLAELISTMLAYNLTYLQERTPDGQYVYKLDPNVEQVCRFPDLPARKPLTYQAKQLIAREIELEKMRRTEAMLCSRNSEQDPGGGLTTNEIGLKAETPLPKSTVRNHEQRLEQIVKRATCDEKPERDFFGRMIVKKKVSLPSANEIPEKNTVGKKIGKAVGESDVWFRFNEGVSNAVRRNIYIKDLL